LSYSKINFCFDFLSVKSFQSSSSLESNLESLAQVLETDLDTYKEHIIDILVKCVCSMPNKLTIYSTLVGLLNAKKYNFGAEVIFFSDLVNCRVITVDSFVDFLGDLINSASQTGIPQVRRD
uniref:MIF4G domain-containing protein n=1 Tax=Brugia pahangi TaxID=6280 RepID=A0A0N4TFW4_BRUPA